MRWAREFTVSSCWRCRSIVLSYPPAAYFVDLGLSHEEASELHMKYYIQYGLALRGLTRHHDVGSVIQAFSQVIIDLMICLRPSRF